MSLDITFLGAAGTVTGSRYLVRTGGRQYLVDCGLFQGGRQMELQNWQPFPVPAAELDAILLTHAHIDHTGYLPRLVKQGFRGPIYATQATCALLEIALPDSGHVQEQDAAYANQKGYSHHKPALPLYGVADAYDALPLLSPVPFDQPAALGAIAVTWIPSGHILGAAILQIEAEGRRVVFSGDLGRYHSALMKPPVPVASANVLLVESTYGDRLHADESVEDTLADILRYIVEKGGVLLIPAFAIGRTQQILYHIRQLQAHGRAPDVPVYIDSPMAVDISDIYCRFGDEHNLSANLLMDARECPLRCRDTHFVRAVEESKQLNTRHGPAVVISASGMCNAGRILHHLKWRLPDRRNAVLFVGYQAAGTRGRLLLDGARRIRIHGEDVPVQARIVQLQALSAHADRAELMQWLSGFSNPPRKIFIVHGEPASSRALQESIQQALGWDAFVPQLGDEFAPA